MPVCNAGTHCYGFEKRIEFQLSCLGKLMKKLYHGSSQMGLHVCMEFLYDARVPENEHYCSQCSKKTFYLTVWVARGSLGVKNVLYRAFVPGNKSVKACFSSTIMVAEHFNS